MLFAIILFAFAVLGWMTLRRVARRAGDPSLELYVRDALRALAETSGLRFDAGTPGGSCAVCGAEDGIEFRVEPGTRGMLFDGDVVIAASCSSEGRVVVWPRDPPDDVIEGLGEERPTRDPVFDARFAVFASSSDEMRFIKDPMTRDAIYELGIVALVIRDDEAVLLLPGIPDGDALQSAAALLARVAQGARRTKS
jgi:hypothetical protein